MKATKDMVFKKDLSWTGSAIVVVVLFVASIMAYGQTKADYNDVEPRLRALETNEAAKEEWAKNIAHKIDVLYAKVEKTSDIHIMQQEKIIDLLMELSKRREPNNQ